ncbi:MAG: aldolase/citrate lyase family protein [bacterium]|nr:aldolase/citrate lyase family protein [bacterium]
MINEEKFFFWSPEEKGLREALKELRDDYGCEALKFETEAEGASFEEIRYYMNLALGQMAIKVKIGGPEARNDIRELLRIGVKGIIAPMVESPYGLKNFITALSETASPEQYQYLSRGFNVETITTYHQIDEIFALPEIREIDKISIGRSDLSGSMGMKPDDEPVMKIVKEVTEKAHQIGLAVSVGGGITPDNARQISEQIKPESINTRNLGFDLSRVKDPALSIQKALEFEIALLEHRANQAKAAYDGLQKRIKVLKERMERR